MKSRGYYQEISKESEILTIGKFKHKTIQHVLRTEPSYILWLHEERIVKFPDDIILAAEENVYDFSDDYPGPDYSSYYDD